MGFYLELVPEQTRGKEFKEAAPPVSYWLLYAIGVFAFICMGTAAHQILGDLLNQGTVWDWMIFFILGLVVFLFLAVGFKMAALRRFVRIQDTELQAGFYCLGFPLILRQVTRDGVTDIVLVNQKPAPNMAPEYHDDPQYFIRGHWRSLVYVKGKRAILIDKHVEKAALKPIHQWVRVWWKGAGP